MVAGAHRSFGRVNRPAPAVLDAAAALKLLEARKAQPNSLLGFGNGKSYGDSCLNERGSIVDMRPVNRILAFDPVTGMFEAEAGVLLSEIIEYVAPHGWFPAVVPGTQFVTLGGAIANDVHGKNHHRRGTFGRHVENFTLLRSDGRTRRCSPTIEPRLFEATIGGMGLTGLILSATIKLMKVPSLDIEERVTRFRNLDEYFAMAARADEQNEYAVAWVDQLAGGANFGRGLLLTGNHASDGSKVATASGGLLSVPFQPPVTVLNRPFLKLFNAAYRFGKTRNREPRRSGYQSFFFPLDGVRNWNLLYGPMGLFQHQSAVPEDAARKAIPAMLEAARKAGQGSFLTVLKRFGSLRSPGIVSFPRPGYTLTLDFPNRGRSTLDLLTELDRITVAAGGAVNPYKDARMSPQTFAASFRDWRLLEAVRDSAFQSDFWMRTAMRLVPRDTMSAAAE